MARVYTKGIKSPQWGPVRRADVESKYRGLWTALEGCWVFPHRSSSRVPDVLGRMDGTLGIGNDAPTWVMTPEGLGIEFSDQLSGGGGMSLPDTISPLGDNFTPRDMTLEAWCYIAPQNNDARIISKASSSAEEDHYFMMGQQGTTSKSIRTRFKVDGTTYTNTSALENIYVGELTHMVARFRNEDVSQYTIRHYVNGEDIGYPGAPEPTGQISGGTGVPIKIGNSAQSGATNEWNAPILKVSIWSRALNDREIRTMAEHPMGMVIPQPRIWVPVSGATIHSGACSMTGSGTVTVAETMIKPGASSMTGSGTVTAAAGMIKPGVVSMTGAGVLTSTAAIYMSGICSMAGSGTLTVTSSAIRPGVCSLTGSGVLTAVAGMIKPAAVVMTGTGVLTATGVIPSTATYAILTDFSVSTATLSSVSVSIAQLDNVSVDYAELTTVSVEI